MRTCTGAAVAAVSSTPAHKGGAASSTPARSFTVRRRRRALGGAVEVRSVNMNAANQLVALEDAVLSLEPTMTAYHRRHRTYKFQVAVDVMFHKAVDPTVVTQPPVTLRTTMAAVYPVDVPQLVETAAHLLELIEVYEHNGSGWFFSNIVSLELSLLHLDPLRASAFVPLPKWIRDKQAVTNIVGTGDDCFKWAVLATLHPVTDHSNRMENYLQYVNLYDFSSLSFPVTLSAVAPFAKRNEMSINVYGIKDGRKLIYPLRVSDAVIPGKHVDLLLHKLGEIQNKTTITDFSRLINGQLSSHHGTVYCCKKCLHAYSSPELLVKHSEDCCHVQNTKFPKDPRCRFTNIQKQLLAPFVVYADFESVLKPFSDIDTTQGVTLGEESSTTAFQEHVLCSFAYTIASSVDPDFSRPLVMYRGEDAAEKFVRDLKREATQLNTEYFKAVLQIHWHTRMLLPVIFVQNHLLAMTAFVTTVILPGSIVVQYIVYAIYSVG